MPAKKRSRIEARKKRSTVAMMEIDDILSGHQDRLVVEFVSIRGGKVKAVVFDQRRSGPIDRDRADHHATAIGSTPDIALSKALTYYIDEMHDDYADPDEFAL